MPETEYTSTCADLGVVLTYPVWGIVLSWVAPALLWWEVAVPALVSSQVRFQSVPDTSFTRHYRTPLHCPVSTARRQVLEIRKPPITSSTGQCDADPPTSVSTYPTCAVLFKTHTIRLSLGCKRILVTGGVNCSWFVFFEGPLYKHKCWISVAQKSFFISHQVKTFKLCTPLCWHHFTVHTLYQQNNNLANISALNFKLLLWKNAILHLDF